MPSGKAFECDSGGEFNFIVNNAEGATFTWSSHDGQFQTGTNTFGETYQTTTNVAKFICPTGTGKRPLISVQIARDGKQPVTLSTSLTVHPPPVGSAGQGNASRSATAAAALSTATAPAPPKDTATDRPTAPPTPPPSSTPCPLAVSHSRRPSTRPDLAAQFTTPANCQTELPFAVPISVTGTISGPLGSAKLYVNAVSQFGQVFPQARDACKPDDATLVDQGRFSTTVYLGTTTQGQGERYDLVLVAADPASEAERQLHAYLQAACADQGQGKVPALPAIPSDAVELSSITVMTR